MYRCIFLALLYFTSAVAAGEYSIDPYNTGWQINTDNDLLTGQSTDRDYAGGIAVALSGKRAAIPVVN